MIRSSGLLDEAAWPLLSRPTRFPWLFAGVLLSIFTLFYAKSACAQTLKRDLRGFSLGMSKDEAAKRARAQCNNFGKVSFHGGMHADEFFASSSEYGKLFSCRFEDGSIVNYALTPRTGKVYKLSGIFVSQLTCPEILDFVIEEFKVSESYSKYHPKPDAKRSCQGWEWQAGPSYDLKVWIDEPEAVRFNIKLIDHELVRENETRDEDSKRQSGVKPWL
ncbi:MAG: hypothetical protein AB7U61_03275 [Methylocystis sp.]